MGENSKTKDTVRLAFIAGLAIVLAVTFVPWGIGVVDENRPLGLAILVAVPLAIGVSIIFFLKERRKIASGLPMQDERSKGIFQKATSYTFYTTMYFVLFFSFLIDEPAVKDFMTVERALMMVLAEMILALFVFLGYFHLKGVLD
jgi:hypothetical protein